MSSQPLDNNTHDDAPAQRSHLPHDLAGAVAGSPVGPFSWAAMRYVPYGLRVLPVKPCDKVPQIMDWQTLASAASDVVQAWCQHYTDCNIGIATGAELIVLDIDRKQGVDGFETLAVLEGRLGALPRTVTVETGGGGSHFYFRKPLQTTIKNSAGNLGPGIDVRGEGGYVVGVPSLHPNGRRYDWRSDCALDQIPIAPLPDRWLQALIRPKQGATVLARTTSATTTTHYGSAALSREADRVARAKEGTRNATLFEASAALGSLCAGGEITESDFFAALTWAGERCGLPAEEAARTIRNGLAVGVAAPRSAPPVLVVQPGELHRLVKKAEAVLLERNVELYQRDGQLVDVRRDPMAAQQELAGDTAVTLRVLDAHALRLILSRHIRLVRIKRDSKGVAKEDPIDPPMDMVYALLAAGDWRFPVLAGATAVPTLRPDGTVLANPGYDEQTWLLFEPGATIFPTVPAVPTRSDAHAALAKLDDVLCDFPFKTDVDKSVALAAMITVVIRAGLRGNCPMFLFDAHTPGSGKTMLADIAAVIGTGRSAPRIAQTRDEETEKRITAHMLAGDQLVVFDNVSHALGGSALDAALAGEIWGGRVLGKSERVQVPNKVTFVATGNNLQIKGDLGRRALRCCLDPAEERPEERRGFRHLHLLKLVRERRPELVVAVLTLVRAYVVAGKPDLNLPTFGSFESWAELVRAPLVWAGVPDPVASQRELSAEADSSRSHWGLALQGMYSLFPAKPFHGGELLQAIAPQGQFNIRIHPVREALLALNPGKELDNPTVGRLLAKWKRRNVGGLRLERHDRDGAGVLWMVCAVRSDASM